MEFSIPSEVRILLETIENNGFTAWCVGGAVRDFFLQKKPYDFDVATSAKPEQVISMFPNVLKTGVKHGTVTVLINNLPIEVTTYRSEAGYSDFRRPDQVDFIYEINEDLARRDFTFNAMAYHPVRGIFDPYGGLKDLQSKLVRAVGDPKMRFLEDPLRILRAYRFASVLGFHLEEETEKAAVEQSFLLSKISAERIFSELSRLLLGMNPSVIETLIQSNGLQFLGITQIKNAIYLNAIPKNVALCFTCLCFCSKTDCEVLLKKLKASNQVLSLSTLYYKLLSSKSAVSKADIKRIWRSNEKILTHINYKELLSAREVLFSEDNQELYGFCDEIIENQEPYLLRHLKIKGNDLKHTTTDGKKIGIILETLLDTIIEHPEQNNNELLFRLISVKYPNE